MEVTLKATELFFLLLLSVVTARETMSALEAVSKGNMAFTTSLYKLLREQEGNVFFSPISIEVILALAYTGAGGNTAKQMATALHLPTERSVLEEGFRSLMESLKSTDNMTLEIANKIFGQKKFPFEASFQAVAEKSFLSAAQEMDFEKDAEGSRQIINQWVEERTNKKITNLIPSGLINSLTCIVLVNAIYFKGNWMHKFNPDSTHPQTFFMTPTENKEVQMMHIKKKFGYAERKDLNAKVLVMPYVGDQVSMVILLPDAVDGLPELEDKLDGLNIGELLKSTDHVEVEVSLPRFKLENTIDLNDHLKKLGMTDMFNDNLADFTGISKQVGVYVSNVLQKAFIEVNEEGSEAAAATAMIMMMRCAIFPECESFVADHPFLFSLFDNSSGTVLFFGRLNKFDA